MRVEGAVVLLQQVSPGSHLHRTPRGMRLAQSRVAGVHGDDDRVDLRRERANHAALAPSALSLRATLTDAGRVSRCRGAWHKRSTAQRRPAGGRISGAPAEPQPFTAPVACSTARAQVWPQAALCGRSRPRRCPDPSTQLPRPHGRYRSLLARREVPNRPALGRRRGNLGGRRWRHVVARMRPGRHVVLRELG